LRISVSFGSLLRGCGSTARRGRPAVLDRRLIHRHVSVAVARAARSLARKPGCGVQVIRHRAGRWKAGERRAPADQILELDIGFLCSVL
jgi:hypothetical protein